MHRAAVKRSARFMWAASVFLFPFFSTAQAAQFTNAADCRTQWDAEFDSYTRQYKQCGPECSADPQRREYRRFSEWLANLREWRSYCQAMSGTEQQMKNEAGLQQQAAQQESAVLPAASAIPNKQPLPDAALASLPQGSQLQWTSGASAKPAIAPAHDFAADDASNPQAGAIAARTWPVSLNTAGQSSCELIRSGEVRYKFHWKEKHGKRCYSNTSSRKNPAACC